MFDDAGRSPRPRKTALLVLGAVVLVASAGCLGFLGGGGGADTSTPAPDPSPTPTPTATSTPTETATPVPGDLPPGVGERGSVSVTELVAAHNETLADASYLVRSRTVRSVSESGPNSTQTRIARVGDDGALRLNTSQAIGGSVIGEDWVWTNGSVAVNRTEVRGDVRYNRLSPTSLRRNAAGARTLSQYLQVGVLTVDDVDQDAGRLTLSATEVDDSADVLSAGTTVEDYAATVVVGTDGQIYEANVTADFTTADGTDATIEIGYRVTDVGDVTVQRPGWVETALEESRS